MTDGRVVKPRAEPVILGKLTNNVLQDPYSTPTRPLTDPPQSRYTLDFAAVERTDCASESGNIGFSGARWQIRRIPISEKRRGTEVNLFICFRTVLKDDLKYRYPARRACRVLP